MPGLEIIGNIENAYLVDTSTNDNLHIVTTKIKELTIANIHKPPTTQWPQVCLILQFIREILIAIAQFKISQWQAGDENNISITFDAKDRGAYICSVEQGIHL